MKLAAEQTKSISYIRLDLTKKKKKKKKLILHWLAFGQNIPIIVSHKKLDKKIYR